MRCVECGQEFGLFEYFLPVLQSHLHDRDKHEPAGYVHLWHLRNPEA